MEFYCLTCKHNLCLQCKERHAINVQTAEHYVLSNEEKNEYLCTEQIKDIQSDKSVELFCKKFNFPICFDCKKDMEDLYGGIGILKENGSEIREYRRKMNDKWRGHRCVHFEAKEECNCFVCGTSLCLQCKEIHSLDLDTIDHNIFISQEKYEFLNQDIYERHRDKMYDIFCNSCKLPVCFKCKKHIETKMGERKTSLQSQLHVVNSLRMNTQLRVRQCFKCRGDAEFYCFVCRNDLCEQCKDMHTIDLDTIDHGIVIYREKYKFSKQEFCERHPEEMFGTFCKTCNLPICVLCRDLEHKKHALIDIGKAYQTNRQQHREIFNDIRWKTQFNSCFLLAEIKFDLKACQLKISTLHLQMKTKAQKLKDLIDTGILAIKVRCKSNMIHILQQRNRKVNRHFAIIAKNEKRFEQSANTPVKFLLLRKKTCVQEIYGTSSVTQRFLLFATDEINRKEIFSLLTEVKITDTDKRQLKNECLLKQMISPVLHRCVEITGLSGAIHISSGILDLVCISDWENHIVFTNTEGDTYKQRHIGIDKLWGFHTFSRACDLIFIAPDIDFLDIHMINKVTKYSTSITNLLKKRKPWTLRCVYCSPCNGDLLVGMCRYDTDTAKVNRYNEKGEHIQTIQYFHTDQELYKSPEYITENRNGDVVVSDWNRAVVVTDRDGTHRFSYTGPPLGPRLLPRGICTDALSNILVCDRSLNVIHIIDVNGHFLTLIQTKQDGIESPHGLGYQANSHLLWVGSYESNRVCVYRYLCRQQTTGVNGFYTSHYFRDIW
ncbi:uncharacterized protein LOC134235512 [Saccostrea cucullata]|uniref:uncharacterized protein LOC134235512 n=1 Tax=Saccostrea cuccullata TaxID=36930 RepID=UPI002ED2D777